MTNIKIKDLTRITRVKFDDEIVGKYVKGQYISGCTENGRYYPTFLISLKINNKWCCNGHTIDGLSNFKQFVHGYDSKQSQINSKHDIES